MARLELIPSTPLSKIVSSPVVSDTTIPTTIPTTIMVTAVVTTGFGMSSRFAYPLVILMALLMDIKDSFLRQK